MKMIPYLVSLNPEISLPGLQTRIENAVSLPGRAGRYGLPAKRMANCLKNRYRKNGQHNRGYDTKGVHTDCPSKRITRNEALASGCYKTEKRLLFHIRHTEDGEMYAAVGTYLQQGGMPLE